MGNTETRREIKVEPPKPEVKKLTIEELIKQERLQCLDLLALPFTKIKPQFYNKLYADWITGKYSVRMSIQKFGTKYLKEYPTITVTASHVSGVVHTRVFHAVHGYTKNPIFSREDLQCYIDSCVPYNLNEFFYKWRGYLKGGDAHIFYIQDFDPTPLVKEMEDFIDWATDQQTPTPIAPSAPPAYEVTKG